MDLVKTIAVGRNVDKLKLSRKLSPDELQSVRDRIVAAGPAAVQPVMRSLGHADARGVALCPQEGADTARLYRRIHGPRRGGFSSQTSSCT